MISIGYGVYPPMTNAAVWVTLISMAMGSALFACVVGSVTAVLMSLDSPTANFQSYLNEMNAFFDHMQTSPELRIKVRNYLATKWSNKDGDRRAVANTDGEELELEDADTNDLSGLRMYSTEKILHELSPCLRKELAFAQCSTMLNRNPIFNESFFGSTLLRWMTEILQPVIFLKGKFCYHLYW